MSTGARLSAAVALAALVLGGGAEGLSAQGFSFRFGRGELGFDGRGLAQVQGVSAGQSVSDYQQWLRLPASGYIVHPAFMRYSVSIRPRLGQHNSTAAAQGTSDRDLGIDFTSTFFQRRDLTLAFQVARSVGSSRGDFGTESEFRNANWGINAYIRDRYFPTTVSFTSRSVQDSWSSAYTAAPILRDQSDTRFRVETRNRKMNAIIERAVHRDQEGPYDHEANSALFRHRVEWGKGSTMNSTLNIYRRSGNSAISRTSLNERLYIAHTRTVGTAFSFGRQTWGRGDQNGRNLTLSMGTSYRPDAVPFEAGAIVSAQSFTSGLGTGTARYRFSPSVRYQKVLPLGISWNTSFAAGLERMTMNLASDDFLDILEERHEIGAIRSFFLEQLRVDRSSVEIWDEARVLLLQEGVDYWILETGQSLEIQIPPGSRVNEGEVVLVNYRFQAIANENVNLAYLNYETSLMLDGLTVRHGRRQRTDDAVELGGAAGGHNETDIWYGLGFTRRTRKIGVSLELGRRTRKTENVDYTADEFRTEVLLPRFKRLESQLRASASRTLAGDAVTRSSTMGATVGLPLSRSLRLSGGLNTWTWQNDDAHIERFITGQSQLVWQYGQVNTLFSFDQVRRSNGQMRVENRWSIRVIRRF